MTTEAADQIEEVLDRTQEPLEYCPICSKVFQEPKMLDCLHSFCLNCLLDLTQHQQHEFIPCPVCGQQTVLPEQGIAGLVGCSSLASLPAPDVTACQGSILTCEACDHGQPAISRCADCRDYLCKNCHDAHQRMLKMRPHKVTLLDLGETQGLDESQHQVPQCQQHPSQDVCFYCETCQVMICAACTVVAHSQPDHTYVTIEEAGQAFQLEVTDLIIKVRAIHVEQRAAVESTQKSRSRLTAMIAEARKKVSKQADGYRATIRQQEKLLHDEIAQINHKRAVEIETSLANQSQILRKTEKRLDMVEVITTKAGAYEILSKKQKIINSLEGCPPVQQQTQAMLHALSFVDFKPLHNASPIAPLGILSLTERWQLLLELGHFKMARGVATNSQGNLAIVDSETNQLVVITNPTEKAKNKDLTGTPNDNLQNPFSVCITGQDQFIVLDSPSVKVFDADGKFTFQFKPSRGNKELESNSLLSALAIGANNLIAVGDRGCGITTLHKTDGSLLRTLKTPKIENQLAASPTQQLIFSSYEDNQLTAIDYHGAVIFSVDTASKANFRNPTGICCTAVGDILVAGHLNSSAESGIYYFNQLGDYLGCVAIGLCNPLSMTLRPQGELVVADKRTVKIYQCE